MKASEKERVRLSWRANNRESSAWKKVFFVKKTCGVLGGEKGLCLVRCGVVHTQKRAESGSNCQKIQLRGRQTGCPHSIVAMSTIGRGGWEGSMGSAASATAFGDGGCTRASCRGASHSRWYIFGNHLC